MKSQIYILFIISILMAGCQKGVSSDDTNPVSTPILLKKFVLLDISQTAPNDTIMISTYSYDSQNRCTSITSTDQQAGVTVTTLNYYNGTDTIIQNRKINYPAGEYDWEYFTYNAAGQMIGDSIISSFGNTLVYKYIVSGSNFELLLHDFTNNIPILKGKFQQTKDAGNNIIAEKDTSFHYDPFGGAYYFNSEAIVSVEYDDHPSPFYRIYPKRLVMLEYDNAASDDFYLYFSIPQKNNVLEEQRSVNPSTTGLDTYHNRYNYQYNADNYPGLVNITDLETGETAKGIYIY